MLDKNLNFVRKLDTPDGEVHIHHALVDYDCFKANYRLIGKISSRIYEDRNPGLMPVTGAFAFNDLAGHGLDLTTMKPSEIDVIKNDKNSVIDTVQLEKDLAFMGEMKRLTNVIIMSNGSWELIPLNQALSSGIITQQQFDGVIGTIVFFTVYRLLEMGSPDRILNGYNSFTTSLNCADYMKSLPMWTPDDITGKVKA